MPVGSGPLPEQPRQPPSGASLLLPATPSGGVGLRHGGRYRVRRGHRHLLHGRGLVRGERPRGHSLEDRRAGDSLDVPAGTTGWRRREGGVNK